MTDSPALAALVDLCQAIGTPSPSVQPAYAAAMAVLRGAVQHQPEECPRCGGAFPMNSKQSEGK